MGDWIIDDHWLNESNSWFLPPPPPPQFASKKAKSPLHAFNDYMYPNVDRLVKRIYS